MGLFSKLFGKKEKVEIKKKDVQTEKNFEDLSQAEKVQMAMDFIKVNAEDNDAESQYQYGVIFFTGQLGGVSCVEPDNEQAKFWLIKSAEQGYVDAICMLGRIYSDENNVSMAIQYYEEAEKLGHPAAMENLGLMYGMGDGVPVDKQKAHEYFLKAAEKGIAFCQYAVGKNYFDGEVVEEDINEAMKWFWAAANQGEEHAEFEIGQYYEYGEKDMETACVWYEKSASKGYKLAIQKLEEL